MLLLNLGHDLTIGADVDGITGAIALASGNYSYRLSDLPELPKLLIDPQLYLSGLDPKPCEATCARLATYPWFQIPNIPQLADGEKKSEFQKKVQSAVSKNWTRQAPTDAYGACLSAINFQTQGRCSHLVLPSPLISEREDELKIQADWLDDGLRALSDTDHAKPVIATVAVDETILNESALNEAGFLDAIADQVSSRPGLNGVYIVICQTHKRGVYSAPEIVNRAYLHLVRRFASTGLENVIVNFADVFGVTCIARGATLVAIGPSQASRNLSLKNFEESGGGRALPHFFCKNTVCEYLSQSELDEIIKKNLWRRIEDITEFSKPLVDVLRAGGTAGKVPMWAESQNNIAYARKHFVKSISQLLTELQGDRDRMTAVTNWLEDAEMLQTYISKKLSNEFPEKRAPVETWLKLLRAHPA